MRNNPIDSWDPDGYVNDISGIENNKKFMKVFNAWKATKKGKQQFELLENSTAVFTWEITDLKGDENKRGSSSQLHNGL